MKIYSIADRIKEIIELEKISVRNFEKKINATQGVINKAINGNSDLKGKILTSIVEEFPHYSSVWLLTGEGEMLLREEKRKDTEVSGSGDCDNCERLKEKIDMLQQLLESKTETIRAYQSKESSNTDSTESKGRNSA